MIDPAIIIATVKSGATALDAVFKTVKSAKEITKKSDAGVPVDVSAIEKRLSEALDLTLSAKQAQLELVEAMQAFQADRAAFEAERAEFQKFRAQASDYILVALADHSFARALKPELQSGDARPYFCAACFDKAKLSMLHFHQREFNFDTLQCRECNGTVRTPNDIRPTVHVAKVNKGWDFF